MKIDILKRLLEVGSDNLLDYRKVTKFDAEGIPYQTTIPGVGGVETLADALKKRTDTNPLITVGDLSGLGDFNNKYGRDVADSAIEKSLQLFAKMFSDIGTAISPSGDEAWFLPNEGVDFKDVNKKIQEFLLELNTPSVQTPDGLVGLNAKFFVGREKFSDVEDKLKYDEDGKTKLPPGVIKIQGSLINKDKDLVVRPEGVSDQKIIYQEQPKSEEVNTTSEEG